jgi:hypothetical protein
VGYLPGDGQCGHLRVVMNILVAGLQQFFVFFLQEPFI